MVKGIHSTAENKGKPKHIIVFEKEIIAGTTRSSKSRRNMPQVLRNNREFMIKLFQVIFFSYMRTALYLCYPIHVPLLYSARLFAVQILLL